MHLLHKYLHVQSYGKAFQNWQIMLLEHVVEKPDYRPITADCVSTCVTLVCHTVNWLYETDPQTPEHVLQFCPPCMRKYKHSTGPKNICRKVLGLQRGLAAANQMHQHHQARFWRIILEYQRHSWETYSGVPLNTSVLIRWFACDVRKQRWDRVQCRTVCSMTYKHILFASARF